MNRRHFIKSGTLALAAAAHGCVSARKSAEKGTVADAFDHEMQSFMEARKVPGGALAVVKDRRLVYARGYGWANREAKVPVKADSLFRIASISKPITGVAVMKLVEQGKLDLNAKAFPLLNLHPAVMSFRDPEPRLRDITIRQLLQHTGGWDRNKSFDPMFRPEQIARATNSPQPATPVNVIRYMLSRELDFDPGTRYAYSNYGYCLLGRVIEKLAGQSYEDYVQEHVLRPIGVESMVIGATHLAGRREHEVRYYDAAVGRSVFAKTLGERCPEPYGAWHLEAMDSHGAWIASAADLVRFASALDDPAHSPLVSEKSIAAMFQRPPGLAGADKEGKPLEKYYGAGWQVQTDAEGRMLYQMHGGSLPGTSTKLFRRADGRNVAIPFNARETALTGRLAEEIFVDLNRAIDEVKEWPEVDLFESVGIVTPAESDPPAGAGE
jgi:N-acyl-D-amino-acid deacylase